IPFEQSREIGGARVTGPPRHACVTELPDRASELGAFETLDHATEAGGEPVDVDDERIVLRNGAHVRTVRHPSRERHGARPEVRMRRSVNAGIEDEEIASAHAHTEAVAHGHERYE